MVDSWDGVALIGKCGTDWKCLPKKLTLEIQHRLALGQVPSTGMLKQNLGTEHECTHRLRLKECIESRMMQYCTGITNDSF